jgi:hypothetical protein
MARINRNPILAGGLKGIGAAVVGIIGSVALKFGTLFLFPQAFKGQAGPLVAIVPSGMPDWGGLVLAALAMILTFAFPVPLIRRLAIVMAAGLLYRLAT